MEEAWGEAEWERDVVSAEGLRIISVAALGIGSGGILAERVCGTGKKPARLMQAAGPYQCLSIRVYPRGSVANTSYQKILDLISGFSPGRARWLSGPLPF